MIKASLYQNSHGKFTGFTVTDHAGYADPGEDIVCAAVSALVINTVNSIEKLAGAAVHVDSDPEKGRISLLMQDPENEKAQLLLQSLALGLADVEAEYDKNMDLIIEEV